MDRTELLSSTHTESRLYTHTASTSFAFTTSTWMQIYTPHLTFITFSNTNYLLHSTNCCGLVSPHSVYGISLVSLLLHQIFKLDITRRMSMFYSSEHSLCFVFPLLSTAPVCHSTHCLITQTRKGTLFK